MDYLRNLGSAAVSSLVQKSGLTLPFTTSTKVTSYDGRSIWTLYEGTKREDGSPVSIFEFDANQPGKRNVFPLAKNALRKLRTIRHPDVLRFIDVVETDSTIHIVTERVRPLAPAITEYSRKAAQEREDWLLWGLHRISVALAFVNDSAASTHGNVRVDSIFISASGEWKLGGFELLSSPKDDAAVLYTMGGLMPDSNACAPPEVKKGGWSAVKEQSPAAADAYALGLLIHAAFNPTQPPPATAQPPHPPPTAASRAAIPHSLFGCYKRLLNPNAKARLTPKNFLELGMAEVTGESSGFFANNRLVKVCAGLDNLSLGSESEKASLLKTLKESASSFPTEFASYKVLPSLVSALQFGGASAPAILPLVLQIGKNVPPQDYATVILSHLVKLFASPDRGTRLALLEHLPEYADGLDKRMVVDKIWPHLQTGFTDTVALIREATVKSIILLSDKLNDRILNNDLLRHLAKAQGDIEPSIRTNTCILLGRIGPALGYNTKKKVLVPAFARALKDPFVHCRVAGVMALMATVECFEPEELATKVIPNMAFGMVDKEKLVRDQAFKAMELFVKKLEENAVAMPETAAVENEMMPGFSLPPTSPGGTNTLVNSAAGAAGALAGWAISSLGKKLAASDLSSTIEGSTPSRPTSAPPPAYQATNGMNGSVGTLSGSGGIGVLGKPLAQTLSSPAAPRPVSAIGTSSSKAKTMHLGANKAPASSSLSDWAMEAAAEAESEEAAHAGGVNPWGNDDLIDVNADQDDWSAFESAPAPVPVINLSFEEDAPPGAFSPSDDWGFASPMPRQPTIPIHQPKPTAATVRTHTAAKAHPSAAVHSPPHVNRVSTISTPTRSSTPSEAAPSPAPEKRGAAPMSKEEKAAEMARRKEERKQRIAALKEHKKHASPSKT